MSYQYTLGLPFQMPLPGADLAPPVTGGSSAGTAPPVYPGLNPGLIPDLSVLRSVAPEFVRSGRNPLAPLAPATEESVTEAGLLGLSWKTWIIMSVIGVGLVLVFRRRAAPRENPRRRRRSRRSR